MDKLTHDQLAQLDPIKLLEFQLQLLQALGLKQVEEFTGADVDIPLDAFGDEIPPEGVDFTNEEGFGGGIVAVVVSLWRGGIALGVWLLTMNLILTAGLRAAWNRGAARVGIQPSEFTARELAARDQFISTQIGFLGGFGEAIVLTARATGGALAPLLQRAQMWTNRFGEAEAEAMQLAAKDQKLMWVWNPLKEHCEDCLRYNGRVYRGSVWEAAQIRPRISELECGGFRCGCAFVLTDDAAMPGRPFAPSGR